MPEQTQERVRLDALMEERRIELGLRWRDLVERGGPTYETFRAIRHGTGEIRPLTKRAIEASLQWAYGSVDAILGGGDPEPLDGRSPRPAGQRYDDDRLQEVSDAVDRLDADPELKQGMIAFADAWYRQQDALTGSGRRSRGNGTG